MKVLIAKHVPDAGSYTPVTVLVDMGTESWSSCRRTNARHLPAHTKTRTP